MDELRHTRFDSSHHRLRTHRVDLDPHVRFLSFIQNRSEIFHLLGSGARPGCERHLPDELDAKPGEPPHFGSRIFRRVAGKIDSSGGNDARPLDGAFIDVLLEREIAFGRTAAGEHGRVSGVEQLLHLLFLIRPGVDVAMRINETRHRRQAPRVDCLHSGHIGRTGRHRSNPAAANHDGSLIDDIPVTDNDPRIRDHDILRCKRPQAAQQAGTNETNKDRQSFHR